MPALNIDKAFLKNWGDAIPVEIVYESVLLVYFLPVNIYQ